jgi:hypothetical protein
MLKQSIFARQNIAKIIIDLFNLAVVLISRILCPRIAAKLSEMAKAPLGLEFDHLKIDVNSSR